MNHKISRRRLLQLTGAAMTTGLLAGCAHGTNTSRTLNQVQVKVPAQYKGRKHTISFWSSYAGVNGKLLNQLVDRYNQSQSNTYVDIEYQGDYLPTIAKIKTALQSGHGPDVTIVAPDKAAGSLLLSDLMSPLDDYFDQDFLSSFVPVFMKEWQLNGKTYQIPFSRSLPLLYYNRDVFAHAGLPDRGPNSWDELRRWNSALKGIENGGKPVRMELLGPNPWLYQSKIWAFGGNLSKGMEMTMDQDGCLACAEWISDLVGSKISFVGDFPDDFNNGFAATMVSSTANLKGVEEAAKFRVGTSKLPRGKSSHPEPTGGGGWMMLTGVPDDRKGAAADMIKFFGTTESSLDWALGTGYVPVVNTALKSSRVRSKIKSDGNFETAISEISDSHFPDAVMGFIGDGDTVLTQAVGDMFAARKDPKATLEQAAQRLTDEAKPLKAKYDKYFG